MLGLLEGRGSRVGRADSSLAQPQPEPLLIPLWERASAHRAGLQDAGEG